MKPTADQLQRIQTAFLATFNFDTLRRMLASKLDTDLEHIAPPGKTLTDVIEAVVYHFARKQDGLSDLLDAALQTEPKSPRLIALHADLGNVRFDPLPRRLAWYIWVLMAAGMMAAVAFAVVTINAMRPLPEPPAVIAPTPTTEVQMTGDLNIAVAQFGILDKDRAGFEAEPNGLAGHILAALQSELAPLIGNSGVEVQWLGPAALGVIHGDSAEARDENAEATAGRHRADLLIYGYVRRDEVQSVVEPFLYVSGKRLLNAQELAGTYSMGGEVQIQGDIEHNAMVSAEASSRMALRANALAKFAMGLGYYAIGRYDKAAPHFAEANRQALATQQDGREAILLFLGNTAVRLNDFPLAGQYYAEALAEDEGYARAYLGAAQVTYQLAKGDCTPGDADIAGIERAIAGYDAAGDALVQPESAEIPTKVAFFKGQAYLCLSAAGHYPDFLDAKKQLRRVTDQYGATQNYRIRYLAADAHALLGRIAVEEAQMETSPERKLALWQESATDYRKALELSEYADRKAAHSLWLAQLAIWQGQEASSDICPEVRTLFADAEQHVASFWAENPSGAMDDHVRFRNEVERRIALACPPADVPAPP